MKVQHNQNNKFAFKDKANMYEKDGYLSSYDFLGDGGIYLQVL